MLNLWLSSFWFSELLEHFCLYPFQGFHPITMMTIHTVGPFHPFILQLKSMKMIR